MADRPTPLSIAVCALIALHSDPSSALNQLEHDEIQEKQLISLLHEAILTGAPKRQNMASLALELQQAACSQTAALFQECLKRLSTSVDVLVDFFSSLQSAISDGTIDGASAQGVFVRRTRLGFDTLSFEGITRLWESFKLQVQEMNSTPALVREEKAQNDEISTMDDELWPLSPLQMEAILREQCTRLEETNHSFEETECEIRRVMACDPELPSAHFLRFLNNLKHGERVGALDALHQYFDYAMIKARKDATSHDKKKVHDVAQYASILLAALHRAFGDESLSLKATEEAVRVSQESRDPASVAYALGWLYCNEMKLNAQDLLERCASRASEGRLRPLVAGANSALARHLLGTETSSAALAWTTLANATTDPPPSSTTISLDRPTHTADVTSSDEAMELLSRQILVGAGIWQAFGLNALSGLSSLVNMNVHDKHLSPHETSLAVRNVARVSLSGSVPETFQLGEYDFSTASSCRYATALRILMNLHKSQKQSDTIYSTTLVLHEWAVRRGDLEHAEVLTNVLYAYLHPRMSNYKAAYVETMLQHVLLLSRQEQWDKSKELAKKVCETCKEEGCGLRVQHATLLIQLALIQLESSSQNFIGALPPIFECLTMCETCAMDSLHATALSILAQVHLRMENTKQAIAVLKATLPSLLQHSHVWFVGEAYLTLAKCQLQQAKKEHAKDAKKKVARMLQSAVDSLNKSADRFRECDDAARLREVYYLQAQTYNSLPDMEEQRNEASKRFVKVSRHLEKGRFSWQRGALSDMSHLEQLASRLPVDS